jgi:hypothetical protein
MKCLYDELGLDYDNVLDRGYFYSFLKDTGFYSNNILENIGFLIDSLREYARVIIAHCNTPYEILTKLGWNYYKGFDENFQMKVFDIKRHRSLIEERFFFLFGSNFRIAKELALGQRNFNTFYI